MARCFYFGCWNEPGHYLYAAPGCPMPPYAERDKITYYGDRVHLDGTLAPRKLREPWSRDGQLCWSGQGLAPNSRLEVAHRSSEYPQGRFLLHHLDNGFTAIQWWDRCQGDTRGACNSTVLLEGVHTSEEMLAALHEHFPHVVENLKRGGPPPPKHPPNEYWKPKALQPPVELVEVKK